MVAHTGCLQAHLASHSGDNGPVAISGYVFGFTVDNADSDRMAQALDYDDPDASIEMMQRTGRWTDAREPFYVQHHDDFSQLPAPWVMFWTCNASAETAQLRAVGGFDEAFRSWGGEDLDLAYRLYLDGANFGVNRAASAIHYPHPQSFEEYGAPGARQLPLPRRQVPHPGDGPAAVLRPGDQPVQHQRGDRRARPAELPGPSGRAASILTPVPPARPLPAAC